MQAHSDGVGLLDSATFHSPPEQIIEDQLDDQMAGIEGCVNGSVLSFFGPLVDQTEGLFRDAAEALVAAPGATTSKLVVVLETHGGYIEVVLRIAEILRHHFRRVEFIVPNYAMSAGTVLVMSGDAIHMDYFSVLGPIDPQERQGDGSLVPALGYLVQYERLIAKSDKGQLTTAELAFLIQKFDPAELYRYEQARELSNSLLKEWLATYKFKDWKETETQGKRVTKAMREARAAEIAADLNDPDKWHSHSRGISMEVLRRDLNLKIEDFGQNEELSRRIKVYCKLLRDYMIRLQHPAALHRRGGYVAFR